jgi:hypothetical protein
VRKSEFDRAVAAEFGARGGSLVSDLVLTSVGGRTPAEALRDGVPPREVWDALCAATDVPPTRRYGVGRMDPPRDAR